MRINLCFWRVGMAIVLWMGALGLSGCTASPEARSAKYMVAGKRFLEKKDYSRAILAFKNAVQAVPNNAEPYYQLGVTALLTGDLRTAVVSLRKAIELNPKHTNAHLKLAELMAHGNEALIREAETRILELRRIAPATPEMLNTLAY